VRAGCLLGDAKERKALVVIAKQARFHGEPQWLSLLSADSAGGVANA
jgi:hypothetical protein